MRLKKCKNCGALFKTENSESYVCPSCAAKRIKESVLQSRTCKQCGISFTGGPRAWYCLTCRAQRQKESCKKYAKKGRKADRPLGSTDQCKKCGKDYIVNSARQKYCSDCSSSAIKAVVREQKKNYYQKNIDKFIEHRNTVRKPDRICVICGNSIKTPTSTITCSAACADIHAKRKQALADYKRGRRKTSVPVEHKNPQSGIPGITYHKGRNRWQLKIDEKYIGLYDSVEEAIKVKVEIENIK